MGERHVRDPLSSDRQQSFVQIDTCEVGERAMKQLEVLARSARHVEERCCLGISLADRRRELTGLGLLVLERIEEVVDARAVFEHPTTL